MKKPRRTIIKTEDQVVAIQGLSSQGEGVTRGIDGKVIFIPGVLPDEKCLIERQCSNQNYDRGTLLAILEPSPDRVDAPCPYYDNCGGCQLQHYKYERQIEFKRLRVQEALERIGGVGEFLVAPTVPSNPWGYRNKVALAVDRDSASPTLGMRKINSLQVVPVADCLIVEDRLRKSIRTLNQIRKIVIPTFDNVFLRILGDSLVVILVLPPERRMGEHVERVALQIGQNLEAQAVFVETSLDRPSTKRTELTRIFGDDLFTVSFGDCESLCGAVNFLQVNSEVAGKLFRAVCDYPWGGSELAVDLYCGVGILTLMLGKAFKSVIGMEVDQLAVEWAALAAKKQKITNVEFFAEALPQGFTRTRLMGRMPDLIVLDPPRMGVDSETLRRVTESGARYLAMISCHPATLARDIAEIKAFRLVCATPFDMFPQTFHVECLAVLERR